jgi:hypothetical protein
MLNNDLGESIGNEEPISGKNVEENVAAWIKEG